MRVNGNRQGKILTAEELEQLFSDGFTLQRDLEEIRFASRYLFAAYSLVVAYLRLWLYKETTLRAKQLLFVLPLKGS